MQLVFNALEGRVWPLLTDLMLRKPITDEGQKNHGGDGRLDVALTPMADFGLAIPYAGFAIMSPVHIRINRDLSDDLLRASLAHQFMHALQFTYQLPGNRLYDRWLMQSTAVWAEDFVYPKTNTEQVFLDAFLDNPGLSLNDTAGGHHFGAYLFPFYLSRTYGPDLIRRMWEATETTGTALEAVNSVIEGGFKQQWPEFARYNWNRPPQDDYSSWDLIARGVHAPEIPVPGPLDGFPAKDYDRSVPTDLRPLAAYYYHFVFRSDEASSVAFYNPFRHVNDPAVKVQALVKMGGAWQKLEDWTSTVSSYSYCPRHARRAGRGAGHHPHQQQLGGPEPRAQGLPADASGGNQRRVLALAGHDQVLLGAQGERNGQRQSGAGPATALSRRQSQRQPTGRVLRHRERHGRCLGDDDSGCDLSLFQRGGQARPQVERWLPQRAHRGHGQFPAPLPWVRGRDFRFHLRPDLHWPADPEGMDDCLFPGYGRHHARLVREQRTAGPWTRRSRFGLSLTLEVCLVTSEWHFTAEREP